MDIIKKYKLWKHNNKGFTLIELIVVLSVLGIIFAIAIPSYVSVLAHTNEKACVISRLQLEKMYELYLLNKDVEHSDYIFEQFFKEFEYDKICPLGSAITYYNNQVRCNYHDNKDNGDGEEEEVPFL